MSNYVCREHDLPTNWKGRGCTSCQEDHEKRQAKKEYLRKRRAAIRNGEELERYDDYADQDY